MMHAKGAKDSPKEGVDLIAGLQSDACSSSGTPKPKVLMTGCTDVAKARICGKKLNLDSDQAVAEPVAEPVPEPVAEPATKKLKQEPAMVEVDMEPAALASTNPSLVPCPPTVPFFGTDQPQTPPDFTPHAPLDPMSLHMRHGCVIHFVS